MPPQNTPYIQKPLPKVANTAWKAGHGFYQTEYRGHVVWFRKATVFA